MQDDRGTSDRLAELGARLDAYRELSYILIALLSESGAVSGQRVAALLRELTRGDDRAPATTVELTAMAEFAARTARRAGKAIRRRSRAG